MTIPISIEQIGYMLIRYTNYIGNNFIDYGWTDTYPYKLPESCKQCPKFSNDGMCCKTWLEVLTNWCSLRIHERYHKQVVRTYCKKSCPNVCGK